jgi:cation/acetate symporter
MMRRRPDIARFGVCTAALLQSPRLLQAQETAAADVQQPLNLTAITLFLLFVATTLYITWWAARRTSSRRQFYAAEGRITPLQNGVAITGDAISAATFLGAISALYFNGLDTLMLFVGIMGSWPIILFLVAERLRNLGRYTLTDVIMSRYDVRAVRVLIALSSLAVTIFYLIGQVVGAGKLIQLLFGLDYVYAVSCVSILMILYVSLGGMLATTWVQFIKALLMISGGVIIVVLLLMHFHFDLGELFGSAVAMHPRGADYLAPGGWLDEPLSAVSVGVTLLFGFLGLPHILMRMFTVKDAGAARKSSFYAISLITFFNLLAILIGFGAVPLLMGNPDYHDSAGQLIGGGNMVVLHVARILGGDLLLGFISAVTFATILAVVSGLTLAGAANIAHDLYAHAWCAGNPSEKTELKISRASVFAIGALAIVLGLAFENQNVVFIANLSLVISGSVNTPVLLGALYWRGMTSRGVIAGSLVGLVSSIFGIILGPDVWVGVLGRPEPVLPILYPTVVTIPVTCITIWIFSITDRSSRAMRERDGFDVQVLRSETGPDTAALMESV